MQEARTGGTCSVADENWIHKVLGAASFGWKAWCGSGRLLKNVLSRTNDEIWPREDRAEALRAGRRAPLGPGRDRQHDGSRRRPRDAGAITSASTTRSKKELAFQKQADRVPAPVESDQNVLELLHVGRRKSAVPARGTAPRRSRCTST
jgi:hypothetical protein